MSAFLDELKAALELPQVPVHEFRTHPRRDEVLHIFVEGGEDIAFFQRQLQLAQVSLETVFYDCDGKTGVLSAYRDVSGIKHRARVAFAVDRDLDEYCGDPVPPPEIYVSDYYSIEWHVLENGAFSLLLSAFYPERRIEALAGKLDGKMEDALRAALPSVLSFTAFVIAARRGGKGIRLSATHIRELIRITGAATIAIRPEGRTKWTNSCCDGNRHSLAFSDLRKAILELRALDYKLWFRGHYAMSMFKMLLVSMSADLIKMLKNYPGNTEFRTFIGSLSDRSLADRTLSKLPAIQSAQDYIKRIVA